MKEVRKCIDFPTSTFLRIAINTNYILKMRNFRRDVKALKRLVSHFSVEIVYVILFVIDNF